MIKALVLAGDVKLLWNAERRGRTALNEDARAALIELLDRFNGTDDAELARWARDHEDAAALRERWGRELATAAAEATAPVWKRTANFDRDAVFAETGEPWAVAKVMDRLADDTRAEVRTLFQGEPAPVHPLEWLGGYVEIEMPDEGDVPDGYQVADYRMGVAKPPGVEIALMLTDDEIRKLHPGVNLTNPADVATAITTSLRSDIASLLADRPPPRTDAAAPVEPAAEQRWRILRPSAPPRYLLAFAFDLWRGQWHKAAVEERRGPRYLPALILPVGRGMGQAMTFRREVNSAQMTLPGLVPVLPAGVEAVHGALVAAKALSPTVAHRLVRWIVKVAAIASDAGRGAEVRFDEQAVARQTAGGVEVEIDGGFDTLRRLLGITKKGSEIEAVVSVFAAHSIPWAVEHYNGGGPLLTFKNERPRPGLAAHLVLSVSPLLCPGMASDKAVRAGDRVLVPALPPPPLPAGGRAHGGLLTLDWLAMVRLGELRAELRAEGGVRLDWPRLANAAGVSPETLDRALDLWTNPATGRWVELPGGLWRLADRGDEGRAHALLIEGAAMSAAGAEAGRRSVRSRQAARNRYGRE